MYLMFYTAMEVTPFKRFHHEAYFPFTPQLIGISKECLSSLTTQTFPRIGEKRPEKEKAPQGLCRNVSSFHFVHSEIVI